MSYCLHLLIYLIQSTVFAPLTAERPSCLAHPPATQVQPEAIFPAFLLTNEDKDNKNECEEIARDSFGGFWWACSKDAKNIKKKFTIMKIGRNKNYRIYNNKRKGGKMLAEIIMHLLKCQQN